MEAGITISRDEALSDEQLFMMIPDTKPAGRRHKVRLMFDKLSTDLTFFTGKMFCIQ